MNRPSSAPPTNSVLSPSEDEALHEDEILRELHELRAARAEKYGYDLKKMNAALAEYAATLTNFRRSKRKPVKPRSPSSRRKKIA